MLIDERFTPTHVYDPEGDVLWLLPRWVIVRVMPNERVLDLGLVVGAGVGAAVVVVFGAGVVVGGAAVVVVNTINVGVRVLLFGVGGSGGNVGGNGARVDSTTVNEIVGPIVFVNAETETERVEVNSSVLVEVNLTLTEIDALFVIFGVAVGGGFLVSVGTALRVTVTESVGVGKNEIDTVDAVRFGATEREGDNEIRPVCEAEVDADEDPDRVTLLDRVTLRTPDAVILGPETESLHDG